MIDPGGAWNRQDVRALVQQPRNGQLRRGTARLPGQLLVGRQQLGIASVVVSCKARHAAADVLGVKSRNVHRSAQEATRHRAEGDEAHAQFSAGIEHRNLGVAGPERILGLQGRDRVHRMGPAQGGGRHL